AERCAQRFYQRARRPRGLRRRRDRQPAHGRFRRHHRPAPTAAGAEGIERPLHLQLGHLACGRVKPLSRTAGEGADGCSPEAGEGWRECRMKMRGSCAEMLPMLSVACGVHSATDDWPVSAFGASIQSDHSSLTSHVPAPSLSSKQMAASTQTALKMSAAQLFYEARVGAFCVSGTTKFCRTPTA